MAIGNKTCDTNKCISCNCKCTIAGGHSCSGCDICTQADNHTRK